MVILPFFTTAQSLIFSNSSIPAARTKLKNNATQYTMTMIGGEFYIVGRDTSYQMFKAGGTNSFTGTVLLPSTTTIGTVGYSELTSLDSLNAPVQTSFLNVAELRSKRGKYNQRSALLGYYTKGDGGGSDVFWDKTSTAADDSGTVFAVSGVATGRWIRPIEGAVNAKWFGASSTLTDAQNKDIIEKSFRKTSKLEYYIPSDLDYGFKRNVRSTFLQLPNVTTYKAITDFSYDNERDGLSGESGSQERKLLYTPGPGGTDNMAWHFNARYHPAISINHNGEDETMLVANGGLGRNRNASVFFGTYGNVNWKVGQGGFTGDSYSDAELAPFQIVVNGLPDLGINNVLTSVFHINKTDGRMGWNGNAPRYAFDFKSRVGQPADNFFGFQSATGYPHFYLQSSENSAELRIRTNATNGYDLLNASGQFYSIESNGAIMRQTVKGTAANIDQFLSTGSGGYTRRLQVSNSNGAYKILTSIGGVGIDSNDDGSVRVGGVVYPSTDNARTLGTSSARWTSVYATTGTINTSDKRLKRDIRKISTTEKKVAKELKPLLCAYKFKDDKNQKIHIGVIAQEVMKVFEKHGLNVFDYSIVTYDSWAEEKDENGNVTKEEGNIYGVRYEELLAFIISTL